jgi:hypothetical protein
MTANRAVARPGLDGHNRGASVEGRGDDPEAKVGFGGDYGVKHLRVRSAPIVKR